MFFKTVSSTRVSSSGNPNCVSTGRKNRTSWSSANVRASSATATSTWVWTDAWWSRRSPTESTWHWLRHSPWSWEVPPLAPPARAKPRQPKIWPRLLVCFVSSPTVEKAWTTRCVEIFFSLTDWQNSYSFDFLCAFFNIQNVLGMRFIDWFSTFW